MLLKQNAKSKLIVKDETEEVVIVKVRQGTNPKNNNEPIVHVEFLDSNNKLASITVRPEGNEDIKKGTAIISQKQWSADSKFGENVSTAIVNVQRMIMSKSLQEALANG